MKSLAGAVALVLSLSLGGSFRGEDGPTPADSASLRVGSAEEELPQCPNGGEMRTAVYDLGEDPDGYASPRAALARFLEQKHSELTPESFVIAGGGADTKEATFVHGRDSDLLVRIYSERLQSGWLVIAYAYCEGSL
jgi:hypothetical protein